jgi:hypothetical protein
VRTPRRPASRPRKRPPTRPRPSRSRWRSSGWRTRTPGRAT